jgi:Zn-dependent metalloprotease
VSYDATLDLVNHKGVVMRCFCCIVPGDVLRRFANDKKLPIEVRKAAAASARVSDEIRKVRLQAGELTNVTQSLGAHLVELASAPAVTVYDCKQSQTLPGTPVPSPKTSKDATVKRAFTETTAVAQFYESIFKRNSVDNAGMTLMSSVHYGVNYNNAMWNGSQMLYGNGDGSMFIDFTKGNDVIGHELTHGVTQHTLQLAYKDDAGGLNESISDCFGSMFRQWQANQDVKSADWLIGHDIMGPVSQKKGFTALRNMANPADTHVLAPQPTKYSQITAGMDPHYSSGPPNMAFCVACKTAGGKSWETVGQVWYGAMIGSPATPNMTMKAFAAKTRQVAAQMFKTTPSVGAAVDQGWKQIGL